jgi:hypothetical protein
VRRGRSLDVLVAWRIVQGATGAPVAPLSQTILLNTFPRRQHPMVLSMFGMAVGVAPVLGPVLGGYLAEAYSWRWAFHMLVPVGLLAFVGLRLALPADAGPRPIVLDWTGFVALAGAMAALQLALARGVRLDWFKSTEILIECLVASVAFYVFIVHCLTTKSPFLNLRLLRDRNYAVGLVLVTIYGMLNFTPMVLLPQFAGFPDALVGQVVGFRGLGMTVGFLTAGLTSRFDPRIGMSAGFLLQVVSGAWMLSFDLNVTMHHFPVDCGDRARNRCQLQSHGGNDLPLQHHPGTALGGRRLGFQQRLGPRHHGQGNHAPSRHDRLSQRLHDVYGGLRTGVVVRRHRPPPPERGGPRLSPSGAGRGRLFALWLFRMPPARATRI